MAYTKAEQDKSIAKIRALAASGVRVGVYHQAELSEELESAGRWLASTFFVNDDGTDHRRPDGSRVSPSSEVCATERQAVEVATAHNIDTIDQAQHRDWFLRNGRSRKKSHPRETSDALSA